MAAKIARRWYWLIATHEFESHGPHNVLDALRYDGARVEHNPPPGFYLFSTDVEHHRRGPQVDRLLSHGLRVAHVFGPLVPELATTAISQWRDEQQRGRPQN